MTTPIKLPDKPKSLRDEAIRGQRESLLREPHIAPLTEFVEQMRTKHPERAIPWFDPISGGVDSRLLLLLEAPGPMASRTDALEGRARRAPSGFVSCDNDDETARNVFEIIRDVGVPRDRTLMWNIVPWYVGDGQRIRTVEREDLDQAQPYLDALLELLPKLEVVVLLGRKALAGWRLLTEEHAADLAILGAPHPSPQVLNPSRTARQELSGTLRIAVRLLGPPA